MASGGRRGPRQALAIGATALAAVLTMSTVSVSASPADSYARPLDLRSGSTRTVLVTLRDHADLTRLPAGHRPARLRHVVRSLRSVARDAQSPLAKRLDAWSATGEVTAYRRLWVVDAISVTATPEAIARIAARRDVASVTADDIRLVPASTSAAAAHLVTDRAPEVWASGDDGSGVVVATLDSGVDVTSPDLESRWRGGGNSWYDPYGQHTGAPRRPERTRHRHSGRHRRRRRVRHRDRRRAGSALDLSTRLRRPRCLDRDGGPSGVPVAAGPGPRSEHRGRAPGRERILVPRNGSVMRPDLPARRPGPHPRRHPAGVRRRQLRFDPELQRQPRELPGVVGGRCARRPDDAPGQQQSRSLDVRRPDRPLP